MNARFAEIIEIADKLSEPAQEKLARDFEAAAMEAYIEEKIAEGEADIAAGRVRPAKEVFEELITRYDLQSRPD